MISTAPSFQHAPYPKRNPHSYPIPNPNPIAAVYKSVIDRERKGDFLGKTVQVVPHITNTIQDWIERVAQIPVDGTPCSPHLG